MPIVARVMLKNSMPKTYLTCWWWVVARQVHAVAQHGVEEAGEARFGIELLETGELIGNCALHHFFEASRRCELGYAIGSRHWGRGYVSEALAALLDYGFDVLGLLTLPANRRNAQAGVEAARGADAA